MPASFRSPAWLALIAGLAFAGGASAATPPVLAAPQIFAPAVISGPANDESPTFSPDGDTLLFTRSGAGEQQGVAVGAEGGRLVVGGAGDHRRREDQIGRASCRERV